MGGALLPRNSRWEVYRHLVSTTILRRRRDFNFDVTVGFFINPGIMFDSLKRYWARLDVERDVQDIRVSCGRREKPPQSRS